MRKLSILMLACMLAMPLGRAEAREITAWTEVTKWGQLPQRFEILGQALPEGVTAADFTLTGEASAWGAASTHPFSCAVASVEAVDGGWALIPERFPDKYFYVRGLEVSCPAHPELSFGFDDIGRTVTPVADDFTTHVDAEHMLTAHVYDPGREEPCPVVIVFHGYGDTDNLLTYRTAVAWAEPESQAARPCWVIAPTIESQLYPAEFARSKIYEGVMAWVDEKIAAGRIDASRIYAMGNSFGGMASFELAERYPNRIAAVLALCPALNYSAHATQNLSLLTSLPVTIAQAEHDETIPSEVGRSAAAALEAAGNPNVTLHIYDDAEMNAAGASLGASETYSFHHVELAVMEDEAYAEWLFHQKRED